MLLQCRNLIFNHTFTLMLKNWERGCSLFLKHLTYKIRGGQKIHAAARGRREYGARASDYIAIFGGSLLSAEGINPLPLHNY